MYAAIIITIAIIIVWVFALCKAAAKEEKWLNERNDKLKEYLKYHNNDVEP